MLVTIIRERGEFLDVGVRKNGLLVAVELLELLHGSCEAVEYKTRSMLHRRLT